MIAIHSIRYVTFASLFMFSGGCIFGGAGYQGSYNSGGNPRPSSNNPRPSSNRPKPAKPKPAKPPQAKPPQAKPPQAKPPRPTPPRPDSRPEPPAPGMTEMVVPVRVNFADAITRVDSMIPKALSQDWQTVSASGAKIKVEVRYKAFRDPIQASFSDRTLKVTVPVRFIADVRASTKLLGKTTWLSRGISWGTLADPQRVTAKFAASVEIQGDYSIKADAKLVDIDHGKAPTGEVCVKAIAKVCMTKESVAPMVHKKLEQALVPQIQKALGQADAQFEKAMNLKKQATQLWTMMQQPQPLQQIGQSNCPSEFGALCSQSAWLVAQLASVGISQPRMDGKDLRVDLAVGGKLTVALGDKPAVKPTALPKLKTETGQPGFAIHAKLRLPTETLGEELSKQLKGQSLGGGRPNEPVVTSVSLSASGDPRHPQRIYASVKIGGPVQGEAKVHGDLVWDARKRELSLKNVDISVETNNAALKQLTEANKAKLIKMIDDKARWSLASKSGALSKAITRALGGVWRGHLFVNGSLDGLKLEKFAVEKGNVAADVLLTGQLDIALSP